MKPFLRSAALVVVLLAAASSHASAAPASEAPYAVVRLTAHGASGTVIRTERGRSLILSCAHAFEGTARTRPLTIDTPTQAPAGQTCAVGIRLLAVDERLDLSLLQLNDGPLPYCAPVAPAGYVPGHNLLSVGYDGMRYPAVRQGATLLGSGGSTTFTREQPRPGRSGGALLDLDTGYLIGVVQGYETSGPRRGMYVSHQAILHFLRQQGRDEPDAARRAVPPPAVSLPQPLCPT